MNQCTVFYLCEPLRQTLRYFAVRICFQCTFFFFSALILPVLCNAQKTTSLFPEIDSIFSDTLIIKIIHLDSTINSKYSDFNPVSIKDSALFFTSIRPDADEITTTYLPVNYISRIYFAKKQSDKFILSAFLSKEINARGTDNADICFAPGYKKFYFSRTELKNNPNKISQLYVCEQKKGKWQKPFKIAGKVNIDGFSSTQPAVGKLADGNEILYFVSDRPGGMGKKDIWYSVLLPEGNYTDPVNLGPPVNTSGDEITPFYHSDSSALYFSSDGHKGLGGFDIFCSKGFKNTWKKVEKIEEPINSKFNDLYFTITPSDSSGYFTSNRPGSFFLTNDTCCYDIYQFKRYHETKLLVIVHPADSSELKTDSLAENNLEITRDSSLNILNTRYPILNTVITLYFDNDYPDPKTLNKETKSDYIDLLKAYQSKRDIYISMYSQSLPENKKSAAEKEISDFFSKKIISSENLLKSFSESLLKLLNDGCKISLEVKGYCSPLFSSPYNLNLSQRRISSFIVYLKNYKNGVLLKYLESPASQPPKLSITKIPFGKNKATATVSDNPNDLRQSIYSPSASEERKIIIITEINNCK
jgi:hypothetical protein